MARIPLLISAVAATAVLAVSPLALATDPERKPMEETVRVLETPALNANMLGMAMCGERDEVVAELSQQFDETPMAVGQVDDKSVVEILVSANGSWTILATGTDGKSCIVSAGEGFESTQLVRGIDV